MLKLDKSYSDYVDETDENYPNGKAVNASSSESFDGTPLLAGFMNNIVGAMQAMYKKAFGSFVGISGIEDTALESQFADAVAKYTDDKVETHDVRRGKNAHGATDEVIPGQIISRDEAGRAKVAAPIESEDIARKAEIDALESFFNNHVSNKNNPHGVTKAQVGLGNVDNTADRDKSVRYAERAGSAPASDVYSWAKQPNKPSYSKAEIGLGNVDNTTDSQKSVKYANSAGSAGSANNADTVDGFHAGNADGMLVPVVESEFEYDKGYIKLGNGLIVQWGSYPSQDDVTTYFDLPFSNKTYTFVAGGRVRIDRQEKEFVKFSPNAKVDGTFGGYWIAIGI